MDVLEVQGEGAKMIEVRGKVVAVVEVRGKVVEVVEVRGLTPFLPDLSASLVKTL